MSEGIETRLVCGFLDAGKTSYIRECIQNDYFHKYGATLILCFEEGEEDYDAAALAERRTAVAYYDGEEDIGAFCLRQIAAHSPDRVYVEMNAMRAGLRGRLPPVLRVDFTLTLLDWATLELVFSNLRQPLREMVSASQQVIFRGCPSKELLAPYSQPFRLMNSGAVYLRQDPLGYHERAFDIFLPFSPEAAVLDIPEAYYLALWLDAADHPGRYEGKTLRFTDPLELRRREDGIWAAGRVVMTCCMADLQFMAFTLEEVPGDIDGGWARLSAEARVLSGVHGAALRLRPRALSPAPPPASQILGLR